MKKQNFEEFIRQNRELFDDQHPPTDLWSRIEKGMPPAPVARRRQINTWKILSVAAIGLVLILSGVIAGLYMSKPDFRANAQYQEFQQAELYFASQIDEKMQLISQYNEDPVVSQDIEQLDVVYEELRKELMVSDNPNKKPIIDAMIVNYQTRIAILEKVLVKLTESEHYQTKEPINEDDFTKL